MRRVAIPFVVAAIIAVACKAYDAEAPAPNDDAGGLDASTADTSTDAGALDAADGRVPFCVEDGGLFCEDYEDPGRVGLAKKLIDDGGVITVDDNDPVQGHFLRTSVTNPPDSLCQDAYVNGAPPGLVFSAGVHVEYKVRPNVFTGGLTLGLVSRLSGGPSDCEMYLHGSPDNVQLVFESAGTKVATDLTRKLVAGKWSRVEIDVAATAGSVPKASVTIDGQSAVSGVDLPSSCQATTVSHLEIGVICATSATGSADFGYDDMRITGR